MFYFRDIPLEKSSLTTQCKSVTLSDRTLLNFFLTLIALILLKYFLTFITQTSRKCLAHNRHPRKFSFPYPTFFILINAYITVGEVVVERVRSIR